HVFFFQADVGIRGRNVTGVQTCALPIFLPGLGPLLGQAGLDVAGLVVVEQRGGAGEGHQVRLPRGLALGDVALDEDVEVPVVVEIGRASCRDRVCVWARAGAAEV